MSTLLETNRLTNRANGVHAPGVDAESTFAIRRETLDEAIALLPEEADRQKLERFWTWIAQRQLDRVRIGKLLRKRPDSEPGDRKGKKSHRRAELFYSYDSVYQLLTGKRMRDGAEIAPMLRSIDAFFERIQPNTRTSDFIETRLHHEIKTYCERCFRLRRIGFVFGMMSTGKSTSGRRLESDNPAWLYTQMPERGQLGDYLRAVAGKCILGARQTKQNLREVIINAIPEGLIVDDADECFRSLRNSWGIDTFQFIKSIYEKRERGIVFMMDNVGRDRLLRGEHSERLLRLWRRRVPPLQLPDVPYPEDLDLFAEAVGLEPAPDQEIVVKLKDARGNLLETHRDNPKRLQDEITSRADCGVGVWRMLLEDARELAAEQEKEIGWGAVIKAYALFSAMEKAAAPDEPEAATRRKR